MTGALILRSTSRGGFDGALEGLYPGEAPKSRRDRVRSLVEEHLSLWGDADIRLFSSPGRAELSGNHTDHNNGRVLAAAVDIDALAAVSASPGPTAEVASRGFPGRFRIDVRETSPVPRERGSTNALIRGVAAELSRRGRRVGGFRACVDSRVLPGSGLSSSASFEVLMAQILNGLYNDGKISFEEIAGASRAAENVFFGKPCGGMDQTACAAGGITAIDFGSPDEPRIEKLYFDFEAAGYTLFIVDTGGSHADLTADYAAVPEEMRSVAEAFGKSVLRELEYLPPGDFLRKAASLRAGPGDRAVLRALHFIEENKRVALQTRALRAGETERFLGLARESGLSSWTLLQNCHSAGRPREQGIPLALAAARIVLGGEGAARVHGGGFAGTIQAFVPGGNRDRFVSCMEDIFGGGSVLRLRVRSAGAAEIIPDRI